MNQLLLMLHLFGFGAGAAASAGNLLVGWQMAAAPEDRPVLGRLPPLFARIGQVGLALLWLTGIAMLGTKYGGGAGLGAVFWVKIAAVVLLTVLIVVLDLRLRRIARGDMAAAAAVPMLGRMAFLTLAVIVIAAVVTFS